MLTNYFWNIDLAESLVPSLHAAELALRNTIHNALTNHFQTDMWFYEPDLLEPGQLGQFARVLGDVAKSSKPKTARRIVAGLMFGFWSSLLSAPYDQKLWAPNSYGLFRVAFPYAGRNRRHDVAKAFSEIAKLRNRVTHYEPVWYRPRLTQEHQRIHDAIGWISPVLAQAILAADSFPAAYTNRAQVKSDLKSHLGLPASVM